MKPVRIPCAKIVHDYTMATLQRLGNLRCTDVYRSMKQRGCIVLPSQGKMIDNLDKLFACVDSFIPSVPMTNKDIEKSKEFVISWKRKLQHIRKQLMNTCKPIYLQTEVARVLKERDSKVKFREVMLEWYLSRFGGEDMTPENVADAVIRHDATDWSKVRPLFKEKCYSIRLDVDTYKEKDVARKYIQWIYRLETGDIPATLLNDLKNDIDVIKEFIKWRNGEPRNQKYKNIYKEFCNRLRTAPVVEKPASDSETQKDEPEVRQLVSPIRVEQYNTLAPRIISLSKQYRESVDIIDRCIDGYIISSFGKRFKDFGLKTYTDSIDFHVEMKDLEFSYESLLKFAKMIHLLPFDFKVKFITSTHFEIYWSFYSNREINNISK